LWRGRPSPNPDHSLLSGEFVHVRLHVDDQPGTLLVPQVALGSSQLCKYVYVADNGKAQQPMVFDRSDLWRSHCCHQGRHGG